jgi:hypothetical protein
MGPFCALDGFNEIRLTLLKRMAGTTGHEPAASAVTVYNDLQQPRGMPKYAEVVQDIAFCG